jgi:hypothetical protein
MKTLLAAASFVIAGFGVASAASTGFILGQGSDGNVYSINTSDASVSLYQALGPIPGIAPNSPNGLGYNKFNQDTAFRTDYNDAATDNFLYRNDEQLVEIPGANQSVASGHVVGDTFYYLDRQGGFYSVDNIFGVAGTQAVTSLGSVPGANLSYGDLAITGDDVYISTGNIFGKFSLADPTSGFTMSFTPSDLFAGLAFDGTKLFGFTADSASLTNELYEISIAAATFGVATYIGDIVLAGVMLTDAAPTPVPLPSAALMLLGGLAGMGVLRRRRSVAA